MRAARQSRFRRILGLRHALPICGLGSHPYAHSHVLTENSSCPGRKPGLFFARTLPKRMPVAGNAAEPASPGRGSKSACADLDGPK